MTIDVNGTSGTRPMWRVMLWGGLAILLALPGLAMMLEAEGVDWSTSDFIVMGMLLALVGLGIECMMRFVRNSRDRRIAIGAIVVGFVLLWAELAVGLVGTPLAGS